MTSQAEFYRSPYAYTLLGKWAQLMELSEEVRKRLLLSDFDPEVYAEYVSRLTRLWLELYPKVEGRTDLDQHVVKDFLSFREFYRNPLKAVEPENAERLFRLEECIRIIFEELGLTEVEG